MVGPTGLATLTCGKSRIEWGGRLCSCHSGPDFFHPSLALVMSLAEGSFGEGPRGAADESQTMRRSIVVLAGIELAYLHRLPLGFGL